MNSFIKLGKQSLCSFAVAKVGCIQSLSGQLLRPDVLSYAVAHQFAPIALRPFCYDLIYLTLV